MVEPSRTRVALRPDEVHVWFVHSQAIDDVKRLAAYEALLSTDERSRHRRFVYDADRHEFLVAHALVRTTLSRYVEVPPQAWQFGASKHGRPMIVGPTMDRALQFNLSHTRGLSACVVALEREVGVDAEDLRRGPANDDIAARYFAPVENAALRAVPPEERDEKFLQFWTLKEAYIKARGVGLALPLDRFAFHLAPERAPAIQIDEAIGDDPATWQFVQFQPGPLHVLAVAIRRLDGREATVRFFSTIPLEDS